MNQQCLDAADQQQAACGADDRWDAVKNLVTPVDGVPVIIFTSTPYSIALCTVYLKHTQSAIGRARAQNCTRPALCKPAAASNPASLCSHLPGMSLPVHFIAKNTAPGIGTGWIEESEQPQQHPGSHQP